MNCIENEIYYHIQRNGNWNKGDTIFIGKDKNPFLSFFDMFGPYIENQDTGKTFNVNSIISDMINYNKTGDKNPEIKDFYHFNQAEALTEANGALNYYLKLTREFIFEEIRKDFFPTLPSRYRCLWVIPNEAEAIKYWCDTFRGEGRLLKLNLNGKIHRTNQEYLSLNTNRMDYIRQQAFKYWAGTSGQIKHEEECLFEGFIEIIDVVDMDKLR